MSTRSPTPTCWWCTTTWTRRWGRSSSRARRTRRAQRHTQHNRTRCAAIRCSRGSSSASVGRNPESVYDHVLTKFGDDEATELESKGTWAKACDAVRGCSWTDLTRRCPPCTPGAQARLPSSRRSRRSRSSRKEPKESPAAAANEGDAPAVTVDTNVRDGAEKVEMDSTPL